MNASPDRLTCRAARRERARNVPHRGRAASAMLAAASLLSVLFAGAPAHAQTALTWNVTSGTWTNTSSWAGAVVPSASDSAVFSGPGVGASSAQAFLNDTTSIFGLSFNGSGSTTIRSADAKVRTLTLGAGGIRTSGSTGPVTIGSGSVDDVTTVLLGSQTWTTLGGTRLTVAGGVRGSALTGTSQTLTFDGAGQAAVTGPIANGTSGGVLNLAKTGLGSLRLSNAASTYSGTTTIFNGPLVVSNGGALGSSGVSVTGYTSTASSTFALGGQLVLDGSQGSVTVSRNLSLQGPSTKTRGNTTLFSVGNNTLSGTIDTAVGETATTIASAAGTLTLAGPLRAVSGTTFFGAGSLGPPGGLYRLTGALSGSGSLQKAGVGTLFLDPSSSADFTGQLQLLKSGVQAAGSNSVRITQNGVLGSRMPTAASPNVSLGGGSVLEVRMDSPRVELSGSLAGTPAFIGFAGSDPSVAQGFYTTALFVDHAVGSTATSGTLVVGAASSIGSTGFDAGIRSRNGYGISVGGTFFGGTFVNLELRVSGPLEFTGPAFWNLSAANGVFRTSPAGGGHMLISGNLVSTDTTSVPRIEFRAGLTTISGTNANFKADLSGNIAIPNFNAIDNSSAVSSRSLGLGTSQAVVIGTSVDPGDAAALTLQRPLLLSASGDKFVYASQRGSNPVVLGNIVNGDINAKNLVLGGTSTLNNLISGSLANNGAGALSLQKTGPGTWVLSGTNTFTGTATISQGRLSLAATAASSAVMADTAGVTFATDTTVGSAGGILAFTGFSGQTTTETVGALTAAAGAGSVVVANNGGGSTTLTFSSLGARTAGATVDFAPAGTDASIVVTGGTNTNAIFSGTNSRAFMTFSGTDWATVTSGTVQRYSGYTTTLPSSGTAGAATNYSISGDATTTGSAVINTLKIVGGSSPPTLTLGGTLTLTARGLLFDNSAGSATISGTGQVGLGGEETIVITAGTAPANPLSINARIGSATGSLTKSGSGLLVIGGSNSYTGSTIVNEGTLRLSGSVATLGAITAAANTTTLRQAATLDLNAAGPGRTVTIGALAGAGTVTNSGGGTNASATLAIGSGSTTASGSFTGILQDGAGVLGVTKNGSGTQGLLGLSTYTGTTRINAGTLEVDVLADGGVASGIGQSSNAAANLVFSGTSGLLYTGNVRSMASGMRAFYTRTASTDRLFTIAGTGTTTLASNAQLANVIVWSNTGAIAFSSAMPWTLALAGTSDGDNQFFPRLTDSGVGANVTSVFKNGTGIWVLGNADNAYSGPTTIADGNLWFASPGSLPATSPLVLGGASGNGVFLGSGTFTRPLAATAVSGSQTVTFSAASAAGAGFAALDKLVVAIGGTASPTTLVWGGAGADAGFLQTGAQLVLGSTVGLNEVEIRNPINLNAAGRTVNVLDNVNTGADFATISGAISGAAGSGLVKNGPGGLFLTGANTYSGTTSITAGMLTVTSLGSTSAAGPSSLGTGVGANLDANALTLGNGSTGDAMLQYVGSGETSDRKIRLNTTTGNTTIYADGVGPVVLTNVANDMPAATGAKMLTLSGNSLEANQITSALTDNTGALSIRHERGTWVLGGQSTYSGSTTLSTTGGILGVGSSSVVSGTLVSGPFGTGTVTITNGFMMAQGAARSVGNNANWGDLTQFSFGGDYDLTFTGSVAMLVTSNNNTLNNDALPGTTLTFNKLAANSLTANTASLTVNGRGNTTIGSVVSTTTNGLLLTKNGSGTLTLGTGTEASWFANRANITVNAGALNIAAPVVSASVTLASGTIGGGSTLSGNTFSITNATGTTAISANLLSGTGVTDLAKSNAGTLVLSGSNSYSGTTRITGGTLIATSTLALPGWNTGRYSVTGAGSVLALGSGFGNADVPTVLAGGTFAANTSIGFDTSGGDRNYGTAIGNFVAGSSTNARGLMKLGSGTLTLSAANTYTGTTAVIEGTLRVGAANALSPRSPLELTGNASLDVANATATGTLTMSGSGAIFGTATLTGSAYVFTNAGPATVSAVLGGAAATLTKSNDGTLVLSGSSTFGGLPTIQAGTVEVTSLANATFASPLGTSGTISLGSGTSVGTLRYAGPGGHSTDRVINLAGSSGGGGILDASGSGPVSFFGGVTNAAGATLTLTGSNTGANYITSVTGSNVVKTGVGTWVFGTNSFTGQLSVQQGTIIAAINAPGGSGTTSALGKQNGPNPVVGLANATGTAALLATDGVTIARVIEVAALGSGDQEVVLGGSGAGEATFDGNSGFRLGRGVTLAADPGGTVRFLTPTNNWDQQDGSADPAVAVTIGTPTATGTVTLETTLPGSITAVTVRQGTLRLGNGTTVGALGPSSVLSGSAGATLAFDRSDTVTSGVHFAATIGGALNVTQLGSGTVVLAGVNTYTGTTSIAAGTVLINGSGRIADSARIDVGAAGRIVFDRSDDYGGAYDGKLTGSGFLSVQSGSLTLTGLNTFTGTSAVLAGAVLKLDGQIDNTALSVDSGATLMGSGTILGTTTIAGLHAPGSSPGIQTLGNLSYLSGASVQWELWNNTILNTSTPPDYDQILLSGNLDFSGATTFNLVFSGSAGPTNYSEVAWSDAFWDSYQEWLVYDVAGTTTGFGNLSLATTNWQDGGTGFFTTARPGSSFQLEQRGNDVYLVYTVVPEPGSLALAAIGLAAAWAVRRRAQRRGAQRPLG